VAVSLAQAADVITFLRLMSVHGTVAEANRLVALGMGIYGPLPLIIAKVALVVLTSAGFAIIARRRTRVSSLVASVGVAAGLIGAYSNVLAL
jgi:hypothetical protein